MNRTTSGITKIQMLNMKSGSTGMQDSIGIPPFLVVGAAVLEGVDVDTGDVRNYNYIISEDGTVYAGVSSVVGKIMIDLIEMIDAGEKIYCTFGVLKTKKGENDAVKAIFS